MKYNNSKFMILIYEQDLTHYRASFYDFLATVIDEKVLIIYGEGEPQSSHIEKTESNKYDTLKIKRRWIGKSYYFQSLRNVKRILKDNNVTCVIHRGAIRNLSLIREISFFKKNKIPVIIRGIGFSVRREFNPKTDIRDFYNKLIIDSADAFLTYTEGSKKILDRFFSPKKVFVAVNTLNSDLIKNHYDELDLIGKKQVKKELGLQREKYIIHVGRFSKRKKIDKLIGIYEILKKKYDLGLILIGNGPELERIKDIVNDNQIKDVIFTGAISSESIITSKYIFASDLFIVPGNLGLMVNHAFLFGKPLIGRVLPKGQKIPKDYHNTPEFEYLIDEFNGIVVEDDNHKLFIEAAIKVFENYSFYSSNALNYAYSTLTVQNMANGYVDAINFAKNHKLI